VADNNGAHADDEIAGLVRSALAREPGARRALYDRHLEVVMGYCVLATNFNRALAEDLTQEVFVNAFSNLEDLRAPSRFRPWLISIAANVCARELARTKRHREVLDAFVVECDAWSEFVGKQGREARAQVVLDAIERVGDELTKTVARLKYTDPEHTVRQISEKLGVPQGTVSVTLMRFRAQVKRVLVHAVMGLDDGGRR
jgi:RNA polymerase sigma-70 factor (ECF subfamily)